MIELKKYHKRGPLGIPDTLRVPEGFYNLTYSKHAKERFEERHGTDPVYPTIVNIDKHKNVIEVYTEDDIHPSQLLVSLQYRKNTKIYLIIIPFENKEALVKTLWFSKPITRKYEENSKSHEENSTKEG